MSDPQAPGEPVEEPAAVDDVVGQANEGLADAEAARRDAVAEPEVVSEEAVVEPDAAPEAVAADAPVADDTPWYERDDVPMDDDAATEIVEPAAVPVAEPATVVAEPVAEPAAAPVVEQTEVLAPTVIAPAATAGTFAQQPQPIFVQAPEPPRPRGNRAATGAIGLIAALCFAVLYLATALVVNLVAGSVAASDIASWLVGALGTWALWVPVVVFFLAFWLLGAIINRGRWGMWVVFGLLVGLAAYGGHILGQLFQAPFWTLTASQGEELVAGQLWVPLAFAAFIFGRELTIWFGAWAAARGKRVSELNYEAQREYERTIEAGPTIVPSAQG
ncbi:ABC transporter [Microbacterium sp.]|uniref:ABC transporter n=1 Tax=Microbacterium sp. TaxID=51671 RepID=UPI0037CC2E8E